MYIGSNLFSAECNTHTHTYIYIHVHIQYSYKNILSNEINEFQLHATIWVAYGIILSKKKDTKEYKQYDLYTVLEQAKNVQYCLRILPTYAV